MQAEPPKGAAWLRPPITLAIRKLEAAIGSPLFAVQLRFPVMAYVR